MSSQVGGGVPIHSPYAAKKGGPGSPRRPWLGTRSSGGLSVLPNFQSHLGRTIASGDNRRMVRRFMSSGILGLPQSRPWENVQSVVTIRPTAPA